jgi:hypothetical protein
MKPGLTVYPDTIVTQPESRLVEGRDSMADRASFLIFYLALAGRAGQCFLGIVEEQCDTVIVSTLQGHTVMRTVKVTHCWSSKSDEYHDMSGPGTEVWRLKLWRQLARTDHRMPQSYTLSDRNGRLTSIRAHDHWSGRDCK